MKNIAIFGAGGFGREVACLIHNINKEAPTWNLIGFFDDNPQLRKTKNEYGEVLGGVAELNAWSEPLSVAIAIGNPSSVRKIAGKIKNSQIDFPNLFAPNTYFLDPENIQFGKGNIVCVGCFFSINVKVGDFNTFNNFISIGHDVRIGDYNSLMPASRLSGEVNLGNENLIGCAAVVLQQLRIGNKTKIGANSTLMSKTKDGHTYLGNPAKIMDL